MINDAVVTISKVQCGLERMLQEGITKNLKNYVD
jgi:hypothetical protein